MIHKTCSRCRQKYEYGKKCSCFYKQRNRDNAIKGTVDNFYTTPAWKTLRNLKLNEYGAVCQRCLVKYGIINTENPQGHHIKPRSKYPKLELNLDNIVILCKSCNLKLGDSDIIDWDRAKEMKIKIDYIL